MNVTKETRLTKSKQGNVHGNRIFKLKVSPILRPISNWFSWTGKRMRLHGMSNTLFSNTRFYFRLNLYLTACFLFIRAPDFSDRHTICKEKLSKSDFGLINAFDIFMLLCFFICRMLINCKTHFSNLVKQLSLHTLLH